MSESERINVKATSLWDRSGVGWAVPTIRQDTHGFRWAQPTLRDCWVHTVLLWSIISFSGLFPRCQTRSSLFSPSPGP